MISQLRMKFPVHVAGKFTFRVLLGTLVALMARSVAQNVLGQPKNLEVVILAESGVRVPTCNGCKTVRTKEAQPPRELTRLPVEVTQDGIFNKRGIPVFLCEFCDEYELKSALEAHQKRIDNK